MKKFNTFVRPLDFLSPSFYLRFPCINHSTQSFSTSSILAKNTSSNPLNQIEERALKPVSHWKVYISNTFHICIGYEVLKTELRGFIDCFQKNYPDYEHFALIWKIRFEDSDVRSLSNTQIGSTKPEEFDKLLNHLGKIFLLADLSSKLSEDESDRKFTPSGLPIGNIFFAYKPMSDVVQPRYSDISESSKKAEIPPLEKKILADVNFRALDFPYSMDVTQWNLKPSGSERFEGEIMEPSTGYIINIGLERLDGGKTNRVLGTWNGIKIFEIRDCMVDKDPSTFTRSISTFNLRNPSVLERGKTETAELIQPTIYNIYKGTRKYLEKEVKVTYIKKIKKQGFSKKQKILTLDLETRMMGKEMIPVCVCIYDLMRGKSYSKLLPNSKTCYDELTAFLRATLIRRMYSGYKVYIHNMAGFDMVFILDALTLLGEVEMLNRGADNTLKITLSWKAEKKAVKTPKIKIQENLNHKPKVGLKKKDRYHYLYLYDSLKIIPGSLDSLSKGFNIETPKIKFPLLFLNEIKDKWFEYKGEIPDQKYFINMGAEDYKEYCNKFQGKPWILKDELIKYCEVDTIALAQLISGFYTRIVKLMNIDILKYPTLPSLTFAGYRANNLVEHVVPKINGYLHDFIKHSYYGGITETYKPAGKNVKSYDVNSLYPSAMRDNYYPCGSPYLFTGAVDISTFRYLGFFRVRVTAPDNLKKPTLPFHAITDAGGRTIFPTGTWEGVYYSEELRDKLQDGYEFEVLDGVYFKHKSKLFRNFIDKLYKIKEESVPGSALYSTSKMLMNSLYGRFGLNPESTRTLIVTPEQSDKIVAKEKNVKIGAVLPSGKVVITYDDKSTDLKKLNISIGIASAIAANSRVVMSGYIRKYSEYLFSIDTDGIKLAVHLDKEEVDPKKLGAMKFEYELKEGVFPLPKVYGGVLVKPYKKYDKEIVKIKGLKNPVKYDELKKLLNKDYKIRVNEERWFRRIDKRTIFVKDLEIKISTNENKRQFIFNEKDELVDTKPLYLKDGVIESSKAKINTSSLSPPSILPHAVKLLELEKTQKKISSQGGEGARSAERRPLRRL